MKNSLEKLEERIGYRFRNRSMLRQALTHSSYVNEHHLDKLDCNERLEFLGDAVLELISSDFLYQKYPEKPEGDMTRLRASMVCEPTLALCAADFELGSYLLLGKGEELTGGRERHSVTSDALEALIGAIYLDGGFANAKEFIFRFVLNDIDNKQLFYDSKTILQEMIQAGKAGELSYTLLGEEGPDHSKIFTTAVLLDGKEIGRGTGHSKKASEAMAAYRAIVNLKEQEPQRTCI